MLRPWQPRRGTTLHELTEPAQASRSVFALIQSGDNNGVHDIYSAAPVSVLSLLRRRSANEARPGRGRDGDCVMTKLATEQHSRQEHHVVPTNDNPFDDLGSRRQHGKISPRMLLTDLKVASLRRKLQVSACKGQWQKGGFLDSKKPCKSQNGCERPTRHVTGRPPGAELFVQVRSMSCLARKY